MFVELLKFIVALIIVLSTYVLLVGTIVVLIVWPAVFVMPKFF